MKPYLRFTLLVGLMLLGSSVLSSFSWVEAPLVPPPVEVKKSRQEVRLERRQQRLKQRLQRASSPQQRQRLQGRMAKLQTQKKLEPSTLFGVLGLSSSVLSFILMFLFFFAWGTLQGTVAWGAWSAAMFAGPTIVGLLCLLFAIAALALCIHSLVLIKKNPEQYHLPGMGIAGIVISSTVLVIMVFVYLGYLIFLSTLPA